MGNISMFASTVWTNCLLECRRHQPGEATQVVRDNEAHVRIKYRCVVSSRDTLQWVTDFGIRGILIYSLWDGARQQRVCRSRVRSGTLDETSCQRLPTKGQQNGQHSAPGI
eukprot:2695756-Pyramimonas_sp.AAC.1